MTQHKIDVPAQSSVLDESSGLILTVKHAFGNESDILVGFPGRPNVASRAFTGDAVLYEAPSGFYEVRVMSQSGSRVNFLVSFLSPHLVFAGNFDSSDPLNTRFSPEELLRISSSLNDVKRKLRESSGLSNEQLGLLDRKIDEIEEASKRLGRKDWINLAAGVIANVVTAAAFAPDRAKAILVAMNSSFGWLFGGAIGLLN